MRQLLNIFCISIIIVNLIGFPLLHEYEASVADSAFQQTLLHDFIPESDYHIVKIPASLYLPTSDSDFQDIAGTVFHKEGIVYEMVKQRIQGDTLYVYCLSNTLKQQVYANLNTYLKNSIGGNANQNNKDDFHKHLLKDFIPVLNDWKLLNIPTYTYSKVKIHPATRIDSNTMAIHSPPPRQLG